MNSTADFEKTYFAASNTGAGFKNYFDSIFLQDERVYILKGGPGTGKSYFLKQVARAAKQRGYEVELYLCSSDADSLDGVRIPTLSISVFDGTSPHGADPRFPGAREDMVNLGAFWNSALLRAHREEIERLCQQKVASYSEALSMLRLAGACMQMRIELLEPYLDREKIERVAKRFVDGVSLKEGKALVRPMRTFGMKGQRSLSTFEEMANRTVSVATLYGVEYLYLQTVLEQAIKRKIEVEYAPHPLMPELPEKLYFPSERLLVCVGKSEKTVGSRRFLDSAVLSQKRKLLKDLEKGMNCMTQAAILAFEEMGKSHFSLEKIYERAMDFEAKQRYCQAFTDEIFRDKKIP